MREYDAYDQAVDYLTENYTPDLMLLAWCEGAGARSCENLPPEYFLPGAILFANVDDAYGCLTGCRLAARHGHVITADPLTLAIANDSRIPANHQQLRPRHLIACAERQREADIARNRHPVQFHPALPRRGLVTLAEPTDDKSGRTLAGSLVLAASLVLSVSGVGYGMYWLLTTIIGA